MKDIQIILRGIRKTKLRYAGRIDAAGSTIYNALDELYENIHNSHQEAVKEKLREDEERKEFLNKLGAECSDPNQ